MREGARDPRIPLHFDGKRFYNPEAQQASGLGGVIRWQLTSHPERSPKFIADVEPSKPPACVEGPELRVTMVNHSTVLLQERTGNILTDPIWSERASPLSWIGPRRRRSPGVRWEDLPRIDAVLLSHNHYDHLDLTSLRRLAARGNSTFVVPTGVARLLRAKNIERVHELDWGESIALRNATIHCVAALHFSGRGLSDRNRTLWCGYVMEYPERRVYFAGDTAFGPHFAGIRERFGSPQIALLPIGAYEPRWFMSPVHMSPDDAVEAHRILGAQETSIAIHHGTFKLADEGLDTPKQRLLQCAPPESFRILNNGQFADFL